MLEAILKPFAYEFMQRALAAGVLAGVTCSIMAFFVIVKKLSFLGHGISHASLGGVAIGVVAGKNPVATGAAFASVVAWVIGFISKKGSLHEDSAIGIISASGMALGVILISLSKTYTMDLTGYLFGNILAVTRQDLIALMIVSGAVLAFVGAFFKELLFMCFDEEGARASGIPVSMLYYSLLTAIAITIIAAIKVVGIVLVGAFLVTPAATGHILSRNFRGMIAISAGTSLASVLIGLVVSYAFDIPSGATIVLCSAAFFAFSLLVSHLALARPTPSMRPNPSTQRPTWRP
ncbi:MAG: metal ABC transporter permease [Firmicutes bacterium]|nr:metal ABC transporter permease [Bacillota bacterium]